MIKAILIFNNHGKPRLSKFYQYYNESQQQQIIKETFQVGWLVLRIQMELKKRQNNRMFPLTQLVSKRDDNVCNFLEGGSLIGAQYSAPVTHL